MLTDASVVDAPNTLLMNAQGWLLTGLLLIAAVSDYRTRRIPNELVLAGAAAGLLGNTLFSTLPLDGFVTALQGLATGLAAFLPLYLLRLMGAGDVKLMAMVGAFLGLPDILYAVLATLLAGGLLSIGFLAWKGGLMRSLGNIKNILLGSFLGAPAGGFAASLQITPGQSAGSLPYGVAIAGGTLGFLLFRQLGWIG